MKPIQVGVLVALSVIAFLIAVGLGTAVNLLSGVPLLGGLTNGVLTAAILTVGLLLVNKWGAATLMWTVFGMLCVPTFTLGPPGFYKVVVAVAAGLVWDAVYQLTGRRRVGLYSGGIAGAVCIMLLMLVFLRVIGTDEMAAVYQRYMRAIWAVLAINVVVTFLGILLGEQLLRRRLSQLDPFRNILRHGE